MIKNFCGFAFFCFFLLFSQTIQAQNDTKPKYNSLLWEITGNGLEQPSYLFGTMHVSSKLAFHLSDSFYYALRNVDAVALELNPELWQMQMIRLENLNQNYSKYVSAPGNEYVSESSFRIKKHDDLLKAALASEPPVVNSLLYRSFKSQDDFEEDTFLDLYIFQTGRKLGKEAAGVEDYVESEKLMLEAYADMAKEKNKKEVDLDGESMNSVREKMQQAYRKGDLDLLDSLDRMVQTSVAFNEKFLYQRNIIQAHSIDTIIQKKSLFVGVGAAHLPGDRGVIELLRKKGYRLRPIQMTDRDAAQKAAVEKLRVPVHFKTHQAKDGKYKVEVPGELYSIQNPYAPLDRYQYADMNNGSYYLITRLKTYNIFSGANMNENLKSIRDLLYENIPGRIISMTDIERNGYQGLDISNRTRNGDLQRYQIFITDFEVIIFKMSGKNDYVDGAEATQFFNSIQFTEATKNVQPKVHALNGFTMQLPGEVHQYYDEIQQRWEYEAVNKNNGDAYLILKKSVYNYGFIAEDSFDISLIEASFRGPDYFDSLIWEKPGKVDGQPAVFVTERLKNGKRINAAHVIRGPHQLVFAKLSNDSSANAFDFVQSIRWDSFRYNSPKRYVDTFLHFAVHTTEVPEIDPEIRALIEKAEEDAVNGNNANNYIAYWPKLKNAIFESQATGEKISVQVQAYPKYYYIPDSVKFWQKEIDDYVERTGLYLQSKQPIRLDDGSYGYHVILSDTGSKRQLERRFLLSDKYLYNISTEVDQEAPKSVFVQTFFNSFRPHVSTPAFDMRKNKLDLFYSDLFSADSALHKFAQKAIINVYYGSKGAASVYNAIQKLSIEDKDYFDSKSKLIAEFGYINDAIPDAIPDYLHAIYQQTADTLLFQNQAIFALSKLKTKHAYSILKNIMIQDPPIFPYTEDYRNLFSNMDDSLELAARLFPDLLQLSTLSDYKDHITDLLVTLVDSGFVKRKDYKKYMSSIIIDAKVALKKQQSKDERIMQEDRKKMQEGDEENDPRRIYGNSFSNSYGLYDYAVLLMPFYEQDKQVQNYFEKLLHSRDEFVKLSTAMLMLRKGKSIPDTLYAHWAKQDKYRGLLYTRLDKIDRADKFPAEYANQLDLSRSYFVADNNFDKMDSVEYISYMPTAVKGEQGLAHFFKYRIKKTDDWKIGISGLQPLDIHKISAGNKLVTYSDKRLRMYEPLQDQLELQLKKVIYDYYPSAQYFFENEYGYGGYDY